MGRDKKNKPKKTEKIQSEKAVRKNQIERERQEEIDDLVQQLMRFLPHVDGAVVRVSRQQVFAKLVVVAKERIAEKKKTSEVMEVDPSEPGPSGIDYEAERKKKRDSASG